ncbi:MAG: hypothetical protein P9X22_06460, partial [Candidatus Zapsychrus exili]|nr:hypothetical protein [Candidatus Zapsychrus exili]
MSSYAFADNIEAILDSADGSSSVSFQDSGAVEVLHVDSDGNLTARGCIRVDSDGGECSEIEGLTVDGNVGIGTTDPAIKFHTNTNAAATTAIMRIENAVNNFDTFISNATPEGSIIANMGDICVDPTNGLMFIKEVGTATNTGWKQVGYGAGNMANEFLSNLSDGNVAVNTSIISDTDSTDDLGSSAIAWANIYGDAIRSATGVNLLIDSATGTLDIDDTTIDLSTQAVGVTLNNVANALNVDSDTFTVDAINNRVGIGTSAPQAVLHVIGDEARYGDGGTLNYASGDGDVYIENVLEVDGHIYGDLSGSVNLALMKGSVVFGDTDGSATEDNANLFWNDTDNYMGIGTAVPTGKLTVKSATDVEVARFLDESGNIVIIDEDGRLGIGTTNPETLLQIKGGDVKIGTGSFDKAGLSDDLYVTGELEVDGSSWQKLVYATSVGIGTSSPTSLLEVQDTDASPIISITNLSDTDYDPIIKFRTGDAAQTRFTIGVDDSDATKFKIEAADSLGATTPALAIDSNEQIGIGTGAPTSLLQIVGGDVKVGTGTFDNAGSSDDLYVTGNLEVDGSVWLGDASADNLTV